MDIQIEKMHKTYGPQRIVNTIGFDIKTRKVPGFPDPESNYEQHNGYLPENNPLYQGSPLLEYPPQPKQLPICEPMYTKRGNPPPFYRPRRIYV